MSADVCQLSEKKTVNHHSRYFSWFEPDADLALSDRAALIHAKTSEIVSLIFQ